MRQRIVPKFEQDYFNLLYCEPWSQAPSDHPHLQNCKNPWVVHELTIAMGKGFGQVESIADLSCGDGTVAKALAEYSGIDPILGDYAAGYEYEGMLADTVLEIPKVELFISGNTLEHLDDPDGDLRLMREKCEFLLVSTPLEEWDDPSGGHYWAWNRVDVEVMLHEAGFGVSGYTEVDLRHFWEPHVFHGIWACR